MLTGRTICAFPTFNSKSVPLLPKGALTFSFTSVLLNGLWLPGVRLAHTMSSRFKSLVCLRSLRRHGTNASHSRLPSFIFSNPSRSDTKTIAMINKTPNKSTFFNQKNNMWSFWYFFFCNENACVEGWRPFETGRHFSLSSLTFCTFVSRVKIASISSILV